MINSRKIPKTIQVKRKDFINNQIKDKSVMHIGCTGGLLGEENELEHINNYNKLEDTHYLFSKSAKEISGIDISKKKIDFLKSQDFENLYVADICDPNFNLEKKYDIILFPNIIEHLSNVGLALQNIKKMMKEDSHLIITTNNAFDILVVLKLLFNYESVHSEHTSYYSYSTMKRSLEMSDLCIENFYYAYNEKKWAIKKNLPQYLFKKFQILFSKIFKQFSEDLIFMCRLK
jgi:SAM-dependent methyltransferase